MDLSYLLGPGNVVPTLKATTKKQVFAEMAARAPGSPSSTNGRSSTW